jgi:small acid-soluble spore protein H (minor)
MNMKRAKEIAASPVMVNVTHDGVPIYIESVADETSAVIHPLDQPGSRQKVSVYSLTEQ